MKLRNATLSDGALILKIRTDAILSHPSTVWTREELQRAADYCDADKIAREIQTPGFTFCIADEVAVAAYIRNHLSYLFVLPSHHNHGYGSALLGVAEKNMTASGYPTIELWAAAYSDGFYAKRGYTKTPERTAPFGLEVSKFTKRLDT